MLRIKGMVQVGGHTFRIERLDRFSYVVVRISDDARIGIFRTDPLAVLETRVEAELMERIARAAVQRGKTSWVRRFGS